MALDPVLKRYFPVALLALTGASAFFQASGLAQLIGVVLMGDEKSATYTSTPRGLATNTNTEHHTSASLIIERNPFDSVKGNLNPPPSATSTGGSDSVAPTVPDDIYSAPSCEGVHLLATAVSEDAAWSFAMVSGGSGEPQASKLVRQGSEYGGKTVWFIRPERMWFVTSSSFCQSEMTVPPKVAAGGVTPAPSASTAAPTGKTSAFQQEVISKIKKIGPHEFQVERGVIDKLFENQSEAGKWAKVVPEQENGKTVGLRMFGIKPDSVLQTLGIENGDRLQSINGGEIASPEKALEAYMKLKTESKVTLTVNRKGQNINLEFNIK